VRPIPTDGAASASSSASDPAVPEPDVRDDAEAEPPPSAADLLPRRIRRHSPVPPRPQARAADDATLDRLLNGLREI